MISSLFSHGYELEIIGYVTDKNSGSSIANHSIEIQIDSISPAYPGYNNIVQTDILGLYYDIIIMPDSLSGPINISTDSCNTYIFHQYWFSAIDSSVYSDFQVCDNNTGNLCEAYYIYYPFDEQNTIQFLDESIGIFNNWVWDFGDGTGSNEQNPLHTYPGEGYYYTSLTIEGDSCYSYFETLVYVFPDTTLCEAMYYYNYTQNPMIVEFIDASIGNVLEWDWNFGDGTTSSLQNPTHQYSDPGTYYTTLNIMTYDSCTSTYGDYIWIYDDTTSCEAAFSYSLDTLNNVPHTYLFSDESEGNIDQWYWDFGDGQFSTEQSPIHIYNAPGTYTVCLNVSSMQSGISCSSMHCDTITTLEYFSFGGQTFIGDYPINIDSGDNENIAKVYLYRKISNSWQYMDQREFWNYGYYWFVDKPEGEYIMFAELLEGSNDYDNYAPSYYPNTLSWKQSEIFNLTDHQQFAVNIHLNELQDYSHGTSSITGNVIEGNSCNITNTIQISDILIQLLNSDNQIIAFTYTNEFGYYSFSGLGYDNYILHAEYPGRYSENYSVVINEGNPLVDDIELTIHCSHILGIDELGENHSLSVSEPTPNPASHKFSIVVSSTSVSKIKFEIINSGGIKFLSKEEHISMGENEYNIDIDKYPQGYYLIIITDNTSGLQKFKKLTIIK